MPPPKGKSTVASQRNLAQAPPLAHSPMTLSESASTTDNTSKLSPLGFGRAAKDKAAIEAEREAKRRAAAEEKARREEEQAEAERIAAEEAAAALRAAEEERLRRLPPPRPLTPPFQPLPVPALTFMWLRDRTPGAHIDVMPSTDKKHVLLPPSVTEQLFSGKLVLTAINGYLPRSDDVRTAQRSISLSSSTPPPGAAAGLAASSPTPKKQTLMTLGGVLEQPPTPAERLAARLEAWAVVRGHCKTLGLEMSDALVTEIADHCDHDALLSFVEGLHQCLKRYDIARREYSKALVLEARAGNRTRAEEVHKEPPPPVVSLVAKKQIPQVVLEGKKGRRDPTLTEADAVPPSNDAVLPASRAPAEVGTSHEVPTTPPVARVATMDAECQTEGRCIIVLPGGYSDASVQYIPEVVEGTAVQSRREDTPPPVAASSQPPPVLLTEIVQQAPPSPAAPPAQPPSGDTPAEAPDGATATSTVDVGDAVTSDETAPAERAGEAPQTAELEAESPTPEAPAPATTTEVDSREDTAQLPSTNTVPLAAANEVAPVNNDDVSETVADPPPAASPPAQSSPAPEANTE